MNGFGTREANGPLRLLREIIMVRTSICLGCLVLGLAAVSFPLSRGADSTELLSVKRASLSAAQQPLTRVLTEFSRQTGIPVDARLSNPEMPIDVTLKDTPFWEALDAIAVASKARVEVVGGNGRLVLLAVEGNRNRWVSYDGPFRTSLKRVTATRDLDSDQGRCNLSLELTWVPDVLPLYVETQPQGLRVLDENSKAVPLTQEGSALASVEGRPVFRLDLALPPVPRSMSKLALVEGKLSAVVPSKMLTFSFNTLDELEKSPPEGRKLTQEGVRCSIDKVVLARDRWTIRVVLALPPGSKKLESHQSGLINNEMVLVSTDGSRRLPSSGYVLEGANSTRATLSYHFRDLPGNPRGKPGDWKVTYRTPARIIEVPIEFSFRDVPLP